MQASEDTNDQHAAGRKKYTCPECQSHFKRAEHLARHERSRTPPPLFPRLLPGCMSTELTLAIGTDRKEQPFGCPYCPSRFSRADLINRHIRRFHPDAQLVDPPKRKKRIDNGGTHTNADECRIIGARHFIDHNVVPDVPIHDYCIPAGCGANLLPPPANMSQVQDSPFYDLSPAFPILFSAEMTNVRAQPSPPGSIGKDVPDMSVEPTNFGCDRVSQSFGDMTPLLSQENFDLGENGYVTEGISRQQVEHLQSRTSMLKRFQCIARFNLPTTKKVEHYLTAFFKYFIPHSPIVHVKSFDFESCSRTGSVYLVYSDISADVTLDPIDWRLVRR